MKKKVLTGLLLAALCLLLMLPGAMAETREGVIVLEGMEEPIEETLFESPQGFSFWYAHERLEASYGEADGIEGVVVKTIFSDDYMVLSAITEEEAEDIIGDYGVSISVQSPEPRVQMDLYLEPENGRYSFCTLLAENGRYLRATGKYYEDAAEGNAKYFQRVLDSVTFTPVSGDAFALRFLDESESESAYLRLDCFLKDEQQGMYLACPDEGKDYDELIIGKDDMYCYESEDDLKTFRLECYLGYSEPDTAPEDAMLRAYAGEYVNQEWIASLAFAPEFGRVYEYRIIKDDSSESGYAIVVCADGITE